MVVIAKRKYQCSEKFLKNFCHAYIYHAYYDLDLSVNVVNVVTHNTVFEAKR